MALSGSFYKYPVGSFGLYCSWSATQNTAGYYSDVTVNVYIQHNALSVGARTGSTIRCGDETYSYTAPALSYASGTALTKTLIGSHTFRVNHDAGGGDKSVILSAVWSFNGTYSGTYVGTITASETISLDAIPQQSNITSLTVDSNNKVTVALTRYVPTFTHSIKFVFGKYSRTIATMGVSESITIPLEWLDTIPNSTTGVGSVQVTTYSGDSQVGSIVTQEFVVTVPESVVPKVDSVVWTKTSSEPDNWPLTQDVSHGKLTASASGLYGSTISAWSMSFAGHRSSTNALDIPNISSSGVLTAVVKVTDSRGRTATEEVEFTVFSYGKPNVTAHAYRSNEDGDEDDVGEYLCITADVSLTELADNALSEFVFGYKHHSSEDYDEYEEIELDPGYPLVIDASSDSTWDWYVRAADAVSSVTVYGSIPTGDVILDIKADGSGVTFGGVAEESGLHSKWDYTGKHITADKVTTPQVDAASVNATDVSVECIYIEQMQVNNQDVVDYPIEQGTNGSWQYRKWSSGRYECWRTATYSGVNFSSSLGSMYYATQSALSYPITFKELPTVLIQTRSVNGRAISVGIDSGTASTSSTGKLYLYSPTTTGTNTYVDLFVIGRWA